MLPGMWRKLAWMALQAAVVAVCVWFEYESARLDGKEPNLGLGIGMGLFFAVIVSAGLVRLIDAYRHGWRASAPADGSASAIKWTTGIFSAILFVVGAATVLTDRQYPPMNAAIAMMVIGAIGLAALLWFWKRPAMADLPAVPDGRVGFPVAGSFGVNTEIDDPGRQRRRLGASFRGRDHGAEG